MWPNWKVKIDMIFTSGTTKKVTLKWCFVTKKRKSDKEVALLKKVTER